METMRKQFHFFIAIFFGLISFVLCWWVHKGRNVLSADCVLYNYGRWHWHWNSHWLLFQGFSKEKWMPIKGSVPYWSALHDSMSRVSWAASSFASGQLSISLLVLATLEQYQCHIMICGGIVCARSFSCCTARRGESHQPGSTASRADRYGGSLWSAAWAGPAINKVRWNFLILW